MKLGFERLDKIVTEENLEAPFNIILPRETELIAEVKIQKNVIGDLKVDNKIFNQSKKVLKLNTDLRTYFKQKSDPRIMAAKPGEFVQPIGSGIPMGSIRNQWDDADLIKYLQSALGNQYFKDLQIEQEQIIHFINYVLKKGFERKNILKYGFCTEKDVIRFQIAINQRISEYKTPIK